MIRAIFLVLAGALAFATVCAALLCAIDDYPVLR